MKKLIILLLLSLALATTATAESWKDKSGITEITAPTGTEFVPAQKTVGATTTDHWFSWDTLKTWVLGDAISLTVDGTTIEQSGTAPNITLNVKSGGIGATQLASTAVTAASYTYANFTVDADGRLTAASNGAAASTTAAGIVEMAIDSEVNTGTATDRAVTPDSLAGSNLGTKEVCWMVKKSDTVTAVADGTEAFVVPASMAGMNLVDVTCAVANLNSAASGATTVVLRRVRGATDVDMTSTGVTVNYDEYTASDETVDTSNDDITTGDKIYVDVNAVTAAVHKGLGCTAMFRLP